MINYVLDKSLSLSKFHILHIKIVHISSFWVCHEKMFCLEIYPKKYYIYDVEPGMEKGGLVCGFKPIYLFQT